MKTSSNNKVPIQYSERIPLFGNNRDPLPGARAVREADLNQRFDVTVIVRPASSQVSSHLTEMSTLSPRQRRYLTRKEFETTHGASREDLQKVEDFARDNGLEVKEINSAGRIVKLSGTVASFSSAFGVKLEHYEHSKGSYRRRKGELTIPKDLKGIVFSVLRGRQINNEFK